MPRPGPRKPQVAVRLSQHGLDYLAERAAEEGLTRSDLLRALIKEATAARIQSRRWPPMPPKEA